MDFKSYRYIDGKARWIEDENGNVNKCQYGTIDPGILNIDIAGYLKWILISEEISFASTINNFNIF